MTDAAVEQARRSALDGARAPRLAARLAQEMELSEQLRSALTSRAVIDQAMGVVMGQIRCSAEAAFDVLRRAAQRRNMKLRDVAADIVAQASGAKDATRPHRGG